MLQCGPFQESHVDEGLSILFANVVNRADVRVVQRGCGLRLALETFECLTIEARHGSARDRSRANLIETLLKQAKKEAGVLRWRAPICCCSNGPSDENKRGSAIVSSLQSEENIEVEHKSPIVVPKEDARLRIGNI